MIGKLAGWGRSGAMLLLMEMFLPGGTLVVLAILLARRLHPGALGKLLGGVPLLGKTWRSAGDDLLVPAPHRSVA